GDLAWRWPGRLGPMLMGKLTRREPDHDILRAAPLDPRERTIRLDHHVDEIGRESPVLLIAERQDQGTDERITRQREPDRLERDHVRSEEHTSELQSHLNLVCR